MKLREVIEYLNATFIPYYQEDYDNSGFLLGDADQEYQGAIVALDLTPQVIDEAISMGANLIATHHPFLFGNGVRRITTANETGRMIMQLIQHKIAVYAAHTNLDNLRWGVSGILAKKLGLSHYKVLQPKEGLLCKLVTFCPSDQADTVSEALYAAGAGRIGQYERCSYTMQGEGSFKPLPDSHPYVGQIGSDHHEAETRIEVIYEKRIERKLITKLLKAHPYEEPAYDCIPLNNAYSEVGGGVYADLQQPMPTRQFLDLVKNTIGIPVIRCSELCKDTVQRIALCGGSGNFLIDCAKGIGADIYLTGDLKYHDFQMAEGQIILGEIGHYESEQFAKEIIYNAISEKFRNFACRISEQKCGYVNYI